VDPRVAALALAELPGVGEVRHRELVARHGSALAALGGVAGAAARARAEAAARARLAAAARAGAALWTQVDAHYPAPLGELHDPPVALYALGAEETLAAPRVAIVGTRDATAYGERVTGELAGALAEAGACVVSGMARGVDARAHRAALEAGGRTVAVLGTGVDVAYPARHATLHAAIAARGLVLSELGPGVPARAGSFPKRNRIIAALAEVTLVVEAGARSGALITADCALELGRTVAAVPGPIDAPSSAGTNLLVRDGAVTITGVDDALALVALARPPARPAAERSALAGDERRVWDALAAGALDLDTLAARASLPARHCLAAVTALELMGAVTCELTGEVRRR
jgi:DNA processing protein